MIKKIFLHTTYILLLSTLFSSCLTPKMVLSADQIKEMDTQNVYIDFADIKKNIIAVSIKEDRMTNQNNGIIIIVKDFITNETAIQTVFSPNDFYLDTVQYIKILNFTPGMYNFYVKQWIRENGTMRDTTWFEETRTYVKE